MSADSSDDATLPAPATGPVRDAALPTVDRAHYEVISEHARGGLGRILRARDRRTGRLVAIKEMLHGDPDAAARFFREALITANLQHPAIVPVYELGRWPDGEPFYAMKLVDGRSLDDVMRDARSLDERLALVPRMIDVSDAVAYAHGEGVIHRDLKPGNVLVGAYGETVVIDWGLAKRIGSEDLPLGGAHAGGPLDTDGRTIAGAVLGTPAYMAPEQARGDEVDARADVYALGAMLYELLSGRLPYGDSNKVDELLARVRVEPPRPLGELEPGVPADLLAVVGKAMAHAREDRYDSARALAEDLRRFLTGKLVGAHAYSSWQLVRRFVRRNRAVLAVAAVLTLALAVTAVVSFVRISDEKRQAEAERAESDRLRGLADVRNNRLILAHARRALESDPTEALAWLQQLPPGAPEWSEARQIASDARELGIARWVLEGHAGNINDLELTHDGERLISGASDATLRVWDLTTGAVTVVQDAEPVEYLELTSDDTQLIAASTWVSDGSAGRRLVVRDLASLTARVVPRDGEARDADIALSPDGRSLAVMDCDAGLRLVDLATMTAQTLRGRNKTVTYCANVLAWSPDGHTLAAETHGPELDLFAIGDVAPHGAGKLTLDGRIAQAQFTGDGARILALTSRTLARWPLGAGAPEILEGGELRGFALGPDGRVVTAGDDHTIRIRDHVLASHSATVNDLVLSADGGTVASASQDGTIAVRTLDGTVSRTLRGHAAGVTTVEISPDGGWIVSASDDRTIRVWSRFGPRRTWSAPTNAVLRAFVVEPGGTLLSSQYDGSVQRWTLDGERTELRAGSDDTNYAGDLAISADGGVIAAARVGGGIDVWRAGVAGPPLGDGTRVAAMAISADGATLAWIGQDAAVFVDRPGTGTRAIVTPGLPSWIHRTLALSSDGERVAWADNEGALGVYDVSRDAIRSIPRPGGNGPEIRNLRIVGDTVISASATGEVMRWDLATDRVTTLLEVVTDEDHRVRFAVSPDKAWLACSDRNHAIHVIELATGVSHTLVGHTDEINDLQFSPDGSTLASASADDDARLWDLTAGSNRVLHHHDDVTSVAFTRDSSRLVTTTYRGTISVILDDVPRDEVGLRAFLRDATNLEVSLEE